MREVWKEIKGLEGLYKVSNKGRVLSMRRNLVLKTNINENGYEMISLQKKKYRVHRLVAEAFIPNIEGKPEINHIDENKLNNKVENLEWATRSENINYGHRNEKMAEKIRKPILQFTKSGELIKEFDSVSRAADELNLRQSNISAILRGTRVSTGGFIFKYKGVA